MFFLNVFFNWNRKSYYNVEHTLNVSPHYIWQTVNNTQQPLTAAPPSLTTCSITPFTMIFKFWFVDYGLDGLMCIYKSQSKL
jgi:hypothetical protein